MSTKPSSVQMTIAECLGLANGLDATLNHVQKPEFDPVIEYALLGSGFQNGKKRISEFFLKNNSKKDRECFLKTEYGTGGFGVARDEKNTITGGTYNSKGSKIEYVDSDGSRKEKMISWKELCEVIQDLILRNKYV